MKTVVITGCSTGFGKETALRLAERGDRVVATMRGVDAKNAQAASELRDAPENSGNLTVVEMDVTSTDSVDAAAREILGDAGAPDAVVNNAGQMYVGVTEAYTAEEFRNQLEVNLIGVHRVTRAFLPAMRGQGSGLFINCSSVAGRIAVPFFAIYHASKWGLEGYSHSLRREIACTGVDVVVVEPGPFETELFPQAPAPSDREKRVDDYPPVLMQTFEAMGTAFEGIFDDPEAPTDPGRVVDAYIRLIDMEPGTRPFRTQVGIDWGVAGLNEATEPHDEAVVDDFGLREFVTIGG